MCKSLKAHAVFTLQRRQYFLYGTRVSRHSSASAYSFSTSSSSRGSALVGTEPGSVVITVIEIVIGKWDGTNRLKKTLQRLRWTRQQRQEGSVHSNAPIKTRIAMWWYVWEKCTFDMWVHSSETQAVKHNQVDNPSKREPQPGENDASLWAVATMHVSFSLQTPSFSLTNRLKLTVVAYIP